MSSYIFVSPGSDPGAGRVLVDPILTAAKPTMGTCRPDLRRMVRPGDHIFVVSGSLGRSYRQYVIGGMEIDEKLEDQLEALRAYPENALTFEGGRRKGNIIAMADGVQNPRDNHTNFATRIKNYIVGKNPIMLETEREVEIGRERSLEILSDLFDRRGSRMQHVIGRNRRLSDEQVERLRRALEEIKQEARS
ncbi:hypothetical protein [Burkholderia pseudomallei]|uniref:hypothetical protein n=2 Tax=Burkholderia pseudomallei TaxID=28450 RepID=UPI001177F86B|nr:hypothetical protein [Burkholderia pseudomallei]MBF3680029.1 hypothetical protein [Burkholderia pseudomallei]MBF3820728.1 hypothetical protein [Burkholderia pseudomallei]MBF4116679.1 hypothetical protein [Burkholderia pseudomallei]MCW0057728.1 hypothetical protein [Burkholderia pseudomallei]